jgi:hypothetical protein
MKKFQIIFTGTFDVEADSVIDAANRFSSISLSSFVDVTCLHIEEK